jgi:hypothetical protein
MPFDPVAYLAGSNDQFDPDAYLGSTSTPVKTAADFAKEELENTPFLQRNLISYGAVLDKALRGVTGDTMTPEEQELNRLAQEAGTTGAIAGEVTKYAPLMAIPGGIAAQAAAGGALGAAYDPTGSRVSSGILEGALSGAGAAVAKALPVVGGKIAGLVSRGKERFLGGPPAESYYGSLDRAREALQKIIGTEKEPAVAALRGAGDQSSAQALMGLSDPAAQRVAALDRIMRKEGIEEAADPLASQAYYAAMDARQAAARQEAMNRLARGATEEETARSIQLMKQRLELALGPERTAALENAARSGDDLRRLIPMLGDQERAYVSALQQQGRMATEAAQQGVLATGERASANQLIEALPEGSYPRDPRIVQPEGLVAGAYPVPGQPRVPPRYAPNVGPQQQFGEAAAELGTVAAERRAAADAIRQQIEASGTPLTVAPIVQNIRSRLASKASRMNPEEQKVLGSVLERLSAISEGGVTDPFALYELRKLGVNQLLGDLAQGADKLTKDRAAAALTPIKKMIDEAITNAGGDQWIPIMEKYAKGLEATKRVELLGVLRDLQKDSPKQFMKIISGEKPKVVQDIMMGKAGIEDAVSESTLSQLRKIAAERARDVRLKDFGKSTEGRTAIRKVLEVDGMSKYMPNLLNRYVQIANAAAREGNMKMNRAVYQQVEKAMRDPKLFADLLEMLPPKERNSMIGYMSKLEPFGGIAGALTGEAMVTE